MRGQALLESFYRDSWSKLLTTPYRYEPMCFPSIERQAVGRYHNGGTCGYTFDIPHQHFPGPPACIFEICQTLSSLNPTPSMKSPPTCTQMISAVSLQSLTNVLPNHCSLPYLLPLSLPQACSVPTLPPSAHSVSFACSPCDS